LIEFFGWMIMNLNVCVWNKNWVDVSSASLIEAFIDHLHRLCQHTPMYNQDLNDSIRIFSDHSYLSARTTCGWIELLADAAKKAPAPPPIPPEMLPSTLAKVKSSKPSLPPLFVKPLELLILYKKWTIIINTYYGGLKIMELALNLFA